MQSTERKLYLWTFRKERVRAKDFIILVFFLIFLIIACINVDKDSLVHSFVCDSRHPKKYSEVNYDELLSIIREKKGESKEQSARVRRLVKGGRDRKTALVLEKHRQAWIKSWKKLKENVSYLKTIFS